MMGALEVKGKVKVRCVESWKRQDLDHLDIFGLLADVEKHLNMFVKEKTSKTMNSTKVRTI